MRDELTVRSTSKVMHDSLLACELLFLALKYIFFFYGVHTDGTEGRDLATAVVGEIGDGGVVGDF